MTGHVHALAVAELAIAGALVTWAPRLAAKLAPYALLALALFGLILAKAYHDGFSSQVLYGLVPAGGGPFRRGFVLPQAGVFFVLGMWLLLRVEAPGAGLVRTLIARWLDPRRGGVSARQGLLLIPVTAMALLLLGPRYWFGMPPITVSLVVVLDAAIAAASLVLVFRSRVWAATVAEAGLLVLGAYGLVIAAFWPSVPGFVYGFGSLASPSWADPRHGRAGHRAARAGAVAGAAGDARARDAPGRRRACGPGPAADPAGADADPDPQRRAWTPRRPNCAGSSGTCTTARRPGWSRSG